MYGYIYKTTNLFNGKIYIGQHKSDVFDENYYGSGVRFTNVFNKYGKDNFICELLEECSSEDELNEREQYWIEHFNATDRNIGYNLMSGGYKVRGIKHSEETKQKISISKTGQHSNRNYTKISDETKLKISSTLKEYFKTHDNPRRGVHLSDVTKEKLRKANLGKKYSETTKAKHRNRPAWNKGVPMAEDAKQHLREINTGKIIARRTVGQFNMENVLLNTYISCTDASRKTGVPRTQITKCCLGHRKSASNYIWKYLD
jgi:group I intron endonuclease